MTFSPLTKTFLGNTTSNPLNSGFAKHILNKGKIEKGYSADFVSVNFSDMEKLNENRLHSKLTISPFDGFDVVFPRNVFVRGEKVISNREIIEDCLGNMISPQVA